ncbi:hypothetical protein MRB53_022054 [Persea americana]|uniref:Uncharacterized protein n=1 Tax=Persea americana TaxID=3435 RepID=A0ACC2L6B8_PERAE|nr:hypothetical protein MRB53_022054 [Persea americana]
MAAAFLDSCEILEGGSSATTLRSRLEYFLYTTFSLLSAVDEWNLNNSYAKSIIWVSVNPVWCLSVSLQREIFLRVHCAALTTEAAIIDGQYVILMEYCIRPIPHRRKPSLPSLCPDLP